MTTIEINPLLRKYFRSKIGQKIGISWYSQSTRDNVNYQYFSIEIIGIDNENSLHCVVNTRLMSTDFKCLRTLYCGEVSHLITDEDTYETVLESICSKADSEFFRLYSPTMTME